MLNIQSTYFTKYPGTTLNMQENVKSLISILSFFSWAPPICSATNRSVILYNYLNIYTSSKNKFKKENIENFVRLKGLECIIG
jgi:hypothetical protein